jgi:hypothetical protein
LPGGDVGGFGMMISKTKFLVGFEQNSLNFIAKLAVLGI